MKETQPLQGVTVLDFTRLLPGPLGTHLMSQLGAKIIKIESPKRLDYTRHFQPKIEDTSVLYHSINHTKEQTLVDYETPEGYQQVCDFIKTSDVLVEQFRPGAMASFKLDFDTVKEINPNIVYVSVTGYGQSGTMSHKAGHDLNFLAQSGLLDLNRDASGKPVIPGGQIADIAGGSYMLMAACTSGLLAQKLQNKPQYIDVSLLDGVIPLNAIPHAMTQGGIPYKQMPILSGMLVNYDVYQCKDGKWIALAAIESKFWKVFCEIAEKPEWKDLKEHELVNGVFDKSELEKVFQSKTLEEWIAHSDSHDACLSPILSLEDVPSHPHVKERNVFDEVQIQDQKLYTYGAPFKTFN